MTLAVPQGAWPVLAVKLNEPVVRPMPQEENGLFSMDALPKLLALAEKADALLIGLSLIHILQVFQSLAGYSLGKADMVRRAMSKKKMKELEKERVNFISVSYTHLPDLRCAAA